MKRAGLVGLLSLPVLIAGTPPAPRPSSLPALGLAMEFGEGLSAAAEQRLLSEARATGVTHFSLALSWSAAEPSPGKYRLGELTRAARVLRQSGAVLHLDLPLVAGRTKDVPADLAAVSFNKEPFVSRFAKLLEALGPTLCDISTLSLGYAADLYFADKPEELSAYRSLFEGAVPFLEKVAPEIQVGVTTSAPTESPAPRVAAALHRKSPVLLYIYAPFEREKPYVHRPPEDLERDWKELLATGNGRPIAFAEVSYSSSEENGSSLPKQAEFVRRLRRFLSSSDGTRLLFARYVSWRDLPVPEVPPGPDASESARRRAIFLAHRGLQTAKGEPKPAWREWVKASR